jgi:hypothetical protein
VIPVYQHHSARHHCGPDASRRSCSHTLVACRLLLVYPTRRECRQARRRRCQPNLRHARRRRYQPNLTCKRPLLPSSIRACLPLRRPPKVLGTRCRPQHLLLRPPELLKTPSKGLPQQLHVVVRGKGLPCRTLDRKRFHRSRKVGRRVGPPRGEYSTLTTTLEPRTGSRPLGEPLWYAPTLHSATCCHKALAAACFGPACLCLRFLSDPRRSQLFLSSAYFSITHGTIFLLCIFLNNNSRARMLSYAGWASGTSFYPCQQDTAPQSSQCPCFYCNSSSSTLYL